MLSTDSMQILIDFCDILDHPSFEEDRKQISSIIRKTIDNAALTRQPPKIESKLGIKDYTSTTEYQRIFKENHALLFEEYSSREITVSTICDWWSKTQKLLPGDFKVLASSPSNSRERWRKQLGNSFELVENDVFMRTERRGWYRVFPLPHALPPSF
jgi:hypothetical protein